MGLKSNLHSLKEKYKGTKMAPAFNPSLGALRTHLPKLKIVAIAS